jgi:hypothetical protein
LGAVEVRAERLRAAQIDMVLLGFGASLVVHEYTNHSFKRAWNGDLPRTHQRHTIEPDLTRGGRREVSV